ncbi:O-antigen ligase [Nocardioides sp. LS1]|uniref:O-antigen ligase family protein n=1 Tax=Nocardioides sp. LS1 TaxID=1027620 RepID=UPI000F61D301|nr:O-antigen ligase family protein [Nocardioides sp. LS1]GCD91332.1 hypothetical protein NLS1_33380 [Nocardioides sp. LS1]
MAAEYRKKSLPQHLDAVTFLTVFLVCLVGIESRLVVGPLGAAGSPAKLVACVGLCWWAFYHVQRTQPLGWRSQPIRISLLLLFLAFMASYVVAMSRPIDAAEVSTANIGLVSLLAWLGIALLANDGIPTFARFAAMSGRIVVVATLLALLGIAQFVLHDPLIHSITIPGLTSNVPLGGLLSRNGFARPSGTALHPIEFGAVLTTVLPIAIARARSRLPERALGSWASVVVLAFGVVVCGSRSALLCAVVGLFVLALVWPPRTKLVAAGGVVVMMAVVALSIPGMTGTMFKLFWDAGNDNSFRSRTDSYAIVQEFFLRSPWLGRGFGTFLPSYRILDNQFLLLLMDVGVLGLLAFLGVLGAAVLCGRAARLHAPDRFTREHGQAYAAATVSAGVGMLTYDGLSFPMGSGMLFLVVGMSGALWRLARTPDAPPPRHSRALEIPLVPVRAHQ